MARFVSELARPLGDEVVLDEIALPVGVRLSPRREQVGAIVVADVVPDGAMRAYEVRSIVQQDLPASPVRMWVFFEHRRSISYDEFSSHWADVHAPLARMHHVGMRRYVQHHVVGEVRGDGTPVHGIAELHFDSLDDFASRFYASDESVRIIGEDVAKFSGRSSDTYITIEQ